MSYREDGDAAHARIAALERELSDTRRELVATKEAHALTLASKEKRAWPPWPTAVFRVG